MLNRQEQQCAGYPNFLQHSAVGFRRANLKPAERVGPPFPVQDLTGDRILQTQNSENHNAKTYANYLQEQFNTAIKYFSLMWGNGMWEKLGFDSHGTWVLLISFVLNQLRVMKGMGQFIAWKLRELKLKSLWPRFPHSLAKRSRRWLATSREAK